MPAFRRTSPMHQGVEGIQLTPDSVQYNTFVDTVMNH